MAPSLPKKMALERDLDSAAYGGSIREYLGGGKTRSKVAVNG